MGATGRENSPRAPLVWPGVASGGEKINVREPGWAGVPEKRSHRQCSDPDLSNLFCEDTRDIHFNKNKEEYERKG